jgi:hypothetical protein
LQHYIKFDAHTIIMLEKLLRSRSFGIIMGHLAHCQVTIHASLGRLGLPLMIGHVALAFLRCWALIAHTLVFHF